MCDVSLIYEGSNVSVCGRNGELKTLLFTGVHVPTITFDDFAFVNDKGQLVTINTSSSGYLVRIHEDATVRSYYTRYYPGSRFVVEQSSFHIGDYTMLWDIKTGSVVLSKNNRLIYKLDVQGDFDVVKDGDTYTIDVDTNLGKISYVFSGVTYKIYK